jgi:hypothetical protein
MRSAEVRAATYQHSLQDAAQLLQQAMQRLQEKEQQLAAAQGEACGARLDRGCCDCACLLRICLNFDVLADQTALPAFSELSLVLI